VKQNKDVVTIALNWQSRKWKKLQLDRNIVLSAEFLRQRCLLCPTRARYATIRYVTWAVSNNQCKQPWQPETTTSPKRLASHSS